MHMMDKKMYLVVIVAVILSMGFVTNVSVAETYYPLKAGATWEYQVMFGAGQVSFSMNAMKPRILDGKQVIPIQSNFGDAYFIIKDSTGVYEFGEQMAEDRAPTIHPQPGYYLKYPLQVGTTWRDETSTFFLNQKVANIPGTLTIETVNDVVTVPAGTFENCIRIKLFAEQTVDMDTREGTGMKISGKANIEIEDEQWYAPNVGLVKAIRKESSNHLMFGSAQMTMQLVKFTE